MKLLLGFTLISGIGWLLDMLSYTILSQVLGVDLPYANFISSMVGVTYVWIVSIGKLFNLAEYGKSFYLPIYWIYQAISILLYSILLSQIATFATIHEIGQFFSFPSALAVKIIVTIPNLLTNFIFMTILTRFMQAGIK